MPRTAPMHLKAEAEGVQAAQAKATEAASSVVRKATFQEIVLTLTSSRTEVEVEAVVEEAPA